MNSATIKLFLPRGDAKCLRTAEISNWTGQAIAAPRTELDDLVQGKELDKAGVYIHKGISSPRVHRLFYTTSGVVQFGHSNVVVVGCGHAGASNP